MRYFLEDLMEFFLVVVLPMSAFTLLAIGGMWLVGSYECGVYENQTGRNTEWAGFSCYVTLENGKVVTHEELKLRNATQGE